MTAFKFVLDSDSLKDLRVDFIRDFSGYVDNLLAPEKRATNPSSSDIINGLPIKPLEQVKIAWLMLKIDCPAHQHGQKTYSVAI
jgi:hypothetical protein